MADRVGGIDQITADTLGQPHDGLAVGRLHDALRAQFQQNRDDTLHTMFGWSLVALVVVGLLAAALGWLTAGRALHPLQRITATARRVAEANLHERIALRGPDDEIKDVADTFDAMLERLDHSFDGQRRFVANAVGPAGRPDVERSGGCGPWSGWARVVTCLREATWNLTTTCSPTNRSC